MSRYHLRDLEALVEGALAVLDSGVGSDQFPLIDGRVLAVQASPELDSSSDMAWGIAALPPGYTVPEHTHRAEEFALILRGHGEIVIEDEPVPVKEGSVLVTPPHLRHATRSAEDSPLVVYWVYGPAGSESRWLTSEEGT